MNHHLTQARLKELLHYDPKTGVFVWLLTKSNRAKMGTRAGNISAVGSRPGAQKKFYETIRIDKISYFAHRLAVLYMTGKWPSSFVDHKDTDSINNKWQNLRCATPSENSQNSCLRSDNKAGVKGVSYCRRSQTWRAKISLNSTNIATELGSYKNKDDAIYVRQAIAALAFGEFARET